MIGATRLCALGQSLWLDNISRQLLNDGTLSRITELAVTGLTSMPTIFEHAIAGTSLYDEAIGTKARDGGTSETIFFDLALQDLRRAADLFRPVHNSTGGVNGWVSLEISPLLADYAVGSVHAAVTLHARAQTRY